jgi:hypothetical protein
VFRSLLPEDSAGYFRIIPYWPARASYHAPSTHVKGCV